MSRSMGRRERLRRCGDGEWGIRVRVELHPWVSAYICKRAGRGGGLVGWSAGPLVG